MTATIEAHGLAKQYGETTALEGLELIAEQGQVTAVLGPNGAGKMTFVRMVATLLRADKGTLLVAGHDARKDPREPNLDEVFLTLTGRPAGNDDASVARATQNHDATAACAA
jgi:ABC-type multidrug transport system ATPase subunit